MVITSLKQLPYSTFTLVLLKKEEDITQEQKDNPSKYVWISKAPKMIMVFTEYVEEIHGKVVTEVRNAV